MMLTKDEVEERLATMNRNVIQNNSLSDNIARRQQREALETALALYEKYCVHAPEPCEYIEQYQVLSTRLAEAEREISALRIYSPVNTFTGPCGHLWQRRFGEPMTDCPTCQVLAENRLLVRWLTDPPMYIPRLEDAAPLTAAEVDRVKRLEAVAEAAKAIRMIDDKVFVNDVERFRAALAALEPS